MVRAQGCHRYCCPPVQRLLTKRSGILAMTRRSSPAHILPCPLSPSLPVPLQAPECLNALNCVVTHHADMFSFGVLLYEMLVGERPWEGCSMVQVGRPAHCMHMDMPLLLSSRCVMCKCVE